MPTKTPTPPRPRRSQARTMRNRLVRKLPAMLDAAIAAYQQIALSAPSDDPKSFAAAHTGAKAALSHIEQIIKLAESAIEKEARSDAPNTDRIEALLSAARSALGGESPEDEISKPTKSTE